MRTAGNYVVITPVRDEERHIEKTILSMAAQTMPPLRHIVVNDGSHDRTGEIIDAYARRFPWLTALHRQDRGYRNSAGGEIDAFYFGFRSLGAAPWEYIVKLDGDLSFDADYFERMIALFSADLRLGMASGVIYNLINGSLQLEHTPRFHVRGAAKMYRRACWEAMNGMYAMNGWDTLDDVKANMLGWRTGNFPDLRIVHYRPTGQAVGMWKNAIKNGQGSYIAGYHPLYMLVKCVKRIVRHPIVVESVGLLYGFIGSYIAKPPRVDDKKLIAYLRRQQLNRLLFRQTIWK